MARDIDSDALTLVQRQFGISGIGESKTELQSDDVAQVFDVTASVRRGRADVANGGWFWGALDNVHTAADQENSFIDPYNAGDFAQTSFPPTVDILRFDLWVIGVSCRILSGAESVVAAHFNIGAPTRSIAFGKDDSGGTLTIVGGGMNIARFTQVGADASGIIPLATEAGETWVPVRMRMPLGSNLVFNSLSVGTTTYRMLIVLGLFPIGLGQDVAY